MKQYNWRYYSVFVLSPLWFALLVFLAVSFEGNITIAFWMALWAGVGGVIMGFIPAILTARFSIYIRSRINKKHQHYQSLLWLFYTVLIGIIISTLAGLIVGMKPFSPSMYKNFDHTMVMIFGFMGLICTLFTCLFLLYQQHKLNKRE